MLVGIAVGFAPFEMYAALNGSNWLSEPHLNRTLVAMVVGGTIGFLIGFLLDTKISTVQQRAAAVNWCWTILIVGVFLFLFFRPAFQGSR